MRDPHVEWLTFSRKDVPNVIYDNPLPIAGEVDEFRFRLEDDILKVEPKEHYSTVEAARKIVDPFVRAWELNKALEKGQQLIKFKFENCKILDRNPPQPVSGSSVLDVHKAEHMNVIDNVTLSVTWKEYPPPPLDFRADADVETLWYRYRLYSQGRDQLLSMAYFCYKMLLFLADGPEDVAAEKFKISRNVLNKLRILSSTKGDLKERRKVERKDEIIPLTEVEKRWIDAAIRKIIKRVGEIDNNPSLPQITMGDLPKLS